jgi:predicted acylesterase/phospholipase RssA
MLFSKLCLRQSYYSRDLCPLSGLKLASAKGGERPLIDPSGHFLPFKWIDSADTMAVALSLDLIKVNEASFIMFEPSSKTQPVRVEKRPQFERIALLLQGGGALGSYQAGAYQALSEANLQPDWVAGVSIGAVNAALIAGNVPERRVEKLREFWEAVSTPPLGVPYLKSIAITNEMTRRLVNQTRALGNLLFGAPSFFTPRTFPPLIWPAETAASVSYYDVTPLKSTLERLVDFDCINSSRMRFSVGAVNVGTGNFTYFDNRTHHITPAHVMASGALPPGFPAIEIEGEYYWDGGLVSNTPLQWVLDSRPHKDTLAFQVDLWSADGELPLNLQEAEVRQKEIQYRVGPGPRPISSSVGRRFAKHLDTSLNVFPMTSEQCRRWRFLRRNPTKMSITSFILFTTPRAMKELRRITSFRAGRWKNIGSPVTMMSYAVSNIPKCYSVPIIPKAFEPSISAKRGRIKVRLAKEGGKHQPKCSTTINLRV